jgi:hypothetical protein
MTTTVKPRFRYFPRGRYRWRSVEYPEYCLKVCAECGQLCETGMKSARCRPCASDRYKEILKAQVPAVSAVNKAVKSGFLAKPATQLCVDCGKQAAYYDHRDYRKPLDVEPVCRSCNRKRGHALDVVERLGPSVPA